MCDGAIGCGDGPPNVIDPNKPKHYVCKNCCTVLQDADLQKDGSYKCHCGKEYKSVLDMNYY